jgi:hypothetical protein
MRHWGGKDKSVRIGHFWLEEKPVKRCYKTTKGDVNFWKAAVLHNTYYENVIPLRSVYQTT